MFDVFFDFLIGVVNDGKKSLKKLNKMVLHPKSWTKY